MLKVAMSPKSGGREYFEYMTNLFGVKLRKLGECKNCKNMVEHYCHPIVLAVAKNYILSKFPLFPLFIFIKMFGVRN